MQRPNSTKKRFQAFIFGILLISIISISGFAVYAMQPVSIQTEVKEPLEILDYPTSFSLYPGETQNFNFTVQNSASVNYFQEFEFIVNDTSYQKYVTFSNYNYSIQPGINKLQAWLTIDPNAPQANFIITINKKTNTPIPTPSPTQTNPTNTSLLPSLQLLAGGARWTAPQGTKALYVNHKDNFETHHLTDGITWGPWQSIERMDSLRTSISDTLRQAGFEVFFSGDIPENLNAYDLVVIKSNYATEPKAVSTIREYISGGGGVVILTCVPSYLSVRCKDWWPGRLGGTDLTAMEDWFGSNTYVNTGGQARLIVDNPFGIDLKSGDLLYSAINNSEAAVTSLDENATVIATWGPSNYVYAFTYEYGAGRMYYQGEVLETNP